MNTVSKALLLSFVCFFASVSYAQVPENPCYIGLGYGSFKLKDASTSFEEKVLRQRYVSGDTEKNLSSKVTEIEAGCFFHPNFALEAGYIPSIKLSTHTSVTVGTHGYNLPTFWLNRELEGSVASLSLLAYTGNRLSPVRAYLGVSYYRAWAEGIGSVSYDKYLIGFREERTKTGFAALRLGVTAKATNLTDVYGEFRYHGPKANTFLFGLKTKL